MPKIRNEIALVILAILAGFLCMLQFTLNAGAVAQTLLPLIALAAFYAFPVVIDMSLFSAVAAFAFLVVFLDEPYNLPFYEGNPPSEMLGPLLFDRLHVLLGIPGWHFTGFEVISILLLGVSLLHKRFTSKPHNALSSDKLMPWMILSLPCAALFAVCYGMLRGNDFGIAMTQNRFIPVLGVWLYLGYACYKRSEHAENIFLILTIATVLKCIEGWYVFIFDFKMHLGSREYLIEHVTSEAIAMSMLYVAYVWWHRRQHVLHDIAAFVLVAVMIGPYLINLRRTSFLGLGLTLMLLPLLYPMSVRLRHVAGAALLAGLATLLVVVTWNLPPPLGVISAPIKRFTNPPPPGEFDYRDVENYNNYRSIMNAPIQGRGFGVTLARYIPLLDISTVYPLYETVPHNNILFIWANGGPIAMAALAATAAFSFAVCLRLGREARAPGARLLGFLGWGMVLRWLVYCWADLGLAFFRLPAVLGLIVGMAIKALAQERKEAMHGS